MPDLKSNEIVKVIAKLWKDKKTQMKGAPSEYTLFYQRRYRELIEKNCNLKSTDITRIIVKEWYDRKKRKH